LIDKLSFLKGASDGSSVSAEEERLMQLFQNRAGLKKAYADLKDEFHLLRDRLKQQEGATIRVQEQLDALGDLLGDPRTGFGALVFFQLRGLWKVCHQQLSGFAADLTRQAEARETAKHKSECEAEKAARLADVDERLQAAAAEADRQRSHFREVQSELARLAAFWHYFARRRLQRSLETLRQGVVAANRSRTSPVCRSAPGATSTSPSSATPNRCASTSMPSVSPRARRMPWHGACMR
jgi:DNA repair exonuclease SbcCD ATPase subunit